MATEYLVPNGNDGGWDVSNHLNIDNGINGGTPDDGTEVSEATGEGVALTLDLSDSAITDGDTVNSVTIRLRARTASGNSDSILVDWVIGGTAQGTQQDTGTLTASFATYTLTNAGWDSDWTAANLDGAQLILTTSQTGMPGSVDIRASEVEVEIDYTPAAGGPPHIVYVRKQNTLLRM